MATRVHKTELLLPPLTRRKSVKLHSAHEYNSHAQIEKMATNYENGLKKVGRSFCIGYPTIFRQHWVCDHFKRPDEYRAWDFIPGNFYWRSVWESWFSFYLIPQKLLHRHIKAERKLSTSKDPRRGSSAFNIWSHRTFLRTSLTDTEEIRDNIRNYEVLQIFVTFKNISNSSIFRGRIMIF